MPPVRHVVPDFYQGLKWYQYVFLADVLKLQTSGVETQKSDTNTWNDQTV